MKLIIAGCLAVLAASVATIADAQPVNRWSTHGMRANRVTRPNDLYVRPPVRVTPRPQPTQKPKLNPRPKYGKPSPAIERIPPT